MLQLLEGLGLHVSKGNKLQVILEQKKVSELHGAYTTKRRRKGDSSFHAGCRVVVEPLRGRMHQTQIVLVDNFFDKEWLV